MQIITQDSKPYPNYVYTMAVDGNFGLSKYGTTIRLDEGAVFKVEHNLGKSEGDSDIALVSNTTGLVAYGFTREDRFRKAYKNEEKLCKN